MLGRFCTPPVICHSVSHCVTIPPTLLYIRVQSCAFMLQASPPVLPGLGSKAPRCPQGLPGCISPTPGRGTRGFEIMGNHETISLYWLDIFGTEWGHQGDINFHRSGWNSASAAADLAAKRCSHRFTKSHVHQLILQ